MQLKEALECVRPVDKGAMEATRRKLDSLIKPLGSFGRLEEHLIKIAGMTGSSSFDFSKKGAVVFCADNGVVDQGVTQSTRDVTAIVAENFTTGDTCLNALCRVAGAHVIPVDIGVAADLSAAGLLQRKIGYGTADFTKEPSMSRDQAVAALEVGINLALELHGEGYGLLSAGEMGIGNTTTGAAVASVLLDLPPIHTTGRGAGLTGEMLEHKREIIRQAISLHHPRRADPLDVLSKVGGYDIAGMAGLCIGAAVAGIPVVLDGFISCVAGLLATRIHIGVREFLLPSHLSDQPACELVLAEMQMEPILQTGMRLGEGTGAVATFPLYDMILEVYNHMLCFADEQMEAYKPLV